MGFEGSSFGANPPSSCTGLRRANPLQALFSFCVYTRIVGLIRFLSILWLKPRTTPILINAIRIL
jgi:hypothetical protein